MVETCLEGLIQFTISSTSSTLHVSTKRNTTHSQLRYINPPIYKEEQLEPKLIPHSTKIVISKRVLPTHAFLPRSRGARNPLRKILATPSKHSLNERYNLLALLRSRSSCGLQLIEPATYVPLTAAVPNVRCDPAAGKGHPGPTTISFSLSSRIALSSSVFRHSGSIIGKRTPIELARCRTLCLGKRVRSPSVSIPAHCLASCSLSASIAAFVLLVYPLPFDLLLFSTSIYISASIYACLRSSD